MSNPTKKLATAVLLAALTLTGCSGSGTTGAQAPASTPDYASQLAAICSGIGTENQKLDQLYALLAANAKYNPGFQYTSPYGNNSPSPISCNP